MAVVLHVRIAAIEWRAPLREPEVLIARVDAPRRGQVDTGGGTVSNAAAIDTIGGDAVARTITIEPPVVVRVLEDVAQCTFGVDALSRKASRPCR